MANQYTKAKLISQKNRKEIFWNLINATLAGGLILLGSLSSGNFTSQGIILSIIASLTVVLAKFQSYWKKEEREYCKFLFNFVG